MWSFWPCVSVTFELREKRFWLSVSVPFDPRGRRFWPSNSVPFEFVRRAEISTKNKFTPRQILFDSQPSLAPANQRRVREYREMMIPVFGCELMPTTIYASYSQKVASMFITSVLKGGLTILLERICYVPFPR